MNPAPDDTASTALNGVLSSGLIGQIEPGPDLGTLNHTALSLEALQARDRRVLGGVLGSWPSNPGVVHRSNRQVLESQQVPLIGALPENASELPPETFRSEAARWLNGLPA
ncbi:AAA family ATPase [Arthrobacter sp.]|uniref:AAA family ATPase n=1 Tax=Arthrobacter sp. TaxID=1667 RepID=UPI002899B47F|nr:AAA family ATPase [Arthrobacter sp.]